MAVEFSMIFLLVANARQSHRVTSQACPRRHVHSAVNKIYTGTLLLPRTSFPLRQSDPAAVEAQLGERTSIKLWDWQLRQSHRPVWTLHDGPPYANGPLHMGHALNKILKDIINRNKLLQGYRVNYIPGFDCHGLPLELKALEAIRSSLSPDMLHVDPISIRKLARQAAETGTRVQTREFEKLAILTDWSKPWRTMDHHYELKQLSLFAQMLENGYIHRSSKPVYFSPSSGTALAEAEIEYNDHHLSRSVYVKFSVVCPSARLAELIGNQEDKPIKLVVWTTTPWTLVANQAVAISSDDDYSLLKDSHGSTDELLVFASSRLPVLHELLAQTGRTFEVVGHLTGKDLSSTTYTHDFTTLELPTFVADHVTMNSGSGLVHTAPSHGQDDFNAYNLFMAGCKLPLEYIDVVDHLGRFKFNGDNPWMSQLRGKEVLGEGNRLVISFLQKQHRLLGAEFQIRHKYPYDWRTKQPVITKITPQWFISLDKIRTQALASLANIQFHPKSSQTRFTSFLNSRSEWCISRQRPWGVPIPVLYNVATGQPLVAPDSISYILGVLQVKGTDYWWTGPVEDFLSPGLEGAYKKCSDTMDVWLDSGVSWTTLDQKSADLVLEGSDQHRGWFQSLLWTWIACNKGAPVGGDAVYRSVVTHGFVLDKHGRKMSKSLGNVISPIEIIDGNVSLKRPKFGLEVLRWWASSVDFTKDVTIDPDQLGHISEIVRKLRSTARFLLGNVFPDGVPAASGLVPVEQLGLIERYALHVLHQFYSAILLAYDAMAFNQVVQLITQFRVNVLSAFYFEVSKDTLYNDEKNNVHRQGVLYVMSQILNIYRFALAPILPHLAEEISINMGRDDERISDESLSIFHEQWPVLDETWRDSHVYEKMSRFLLLRDRIQAELESLRRDKKITVSGEVEAVIDLSACGQQQHPIICDLLQHAELLPRLLGLSDVSVCKTSNAAQTVVNLASPAWKHQVQCKVLSETLSLTVVLLPAWRSKCTRCWNFVAENHDPLCERCVTVLSSSLKTKNESRP